VLKYNGPEDEMSDKCEVIQGRLRLMIKQMLNGLLSYQMIVVCEKCMEKV
jgi:hypothetical protein